MQINFYMSQEDQEDFHNYIFERGGYIMPEIWTNIIVPVIKNQIDLPQHRTQGRISLCNPPHGIFLTSPPMDNPALIRPTIQYP